MAHLTARGGYARLVERLNQFPQGAPPAELLYRILELLFTPREAELVARLPIRPFTAGRAAAAWQVPAAEARATLDALASRGLLLDVERDGEQTYVLPPPMAGFFEFSLMRVRTDVDQRLLSQLYYEYITVEDDFVRALFADGQTQLGRAFVQEPVLGRQPDLQVLDYERASWVVEEATDRGIGLCYCRHKMQHLDRACGAPLEICMTFGGTATSLIAHGILRRVDRAECLDLLQRARDLRLVQFGENVQRQVAFICNCCGCCCEAMVAARRFGSLRPVQTTSFLPAVDEGACTGCGRCVEACPVGSMGLASAQDPRQPRKRRARVEAATCLGCGVCAAACAEGHVRLVRRAERVITPVNSTHRIVLMAIERGKLQNLIADHQALASHRAMAAILGVILRLPPAKQLLASQQLRSRYLAALLERGGRTGGS